MLGLVVKVLRLAGRSRGQTGLIEPQRVDVLAAAHPLNTVLFDVDNHLVTKKVDIKFLIVIQ